MDKSLNLLMQEFEEGLVNYVNSSPIPVKAKVLILQSVLAPLVQCNMQSVANERVKIKKDNAVATEKQESICSNTQENTK